MFKLSPAGPELVAPVGIRGRNPAAIDLIDQGDFGLEGLSIHEWIAHVHT